MITKFDQAIQIAAHRQYKDMVVLATYLLNNAKENVRIWENLPGKYSDIVAKAGITKLDPEDFFLGPDGFSVRLPNGWESSTSCHGEFLIPNKPVFLPGFALKEKETPKQRTDIGFLSTGNTPPTRSVNREISIWSGAMLKPIASIQVLDTGFNFFNRGENSFLPNVEGVILRTKQVAAAFPNEARFHELRKKYAEETLRRMLCD